MDIGPGSGKLNRNHCFGSEKREHYQALDRYTAHCLTLAGKMPARTGGTPALPPERASAMVTELGVHPFKIPLFPPLLRVSASLR